MKIHEFYNRHKTLLISVILMFVVFILTVFMLYYYYFYPDTQIGPKQPIPFSHRLHVTEKQIDCRYCHSYVDKSKHAGLPPVETCMNCHRYIITHLPAILDLTKYYNDNRSIPWVRINKLPDHVYFNHSRHIQKNVECINCHGEVEKMDRIFEKNQFLMGFCVTCHRERKAPLDCWTCHR
jgi:hypothetical protein